MNLNSITTKISLIFLIAILMLIALFLFYLDYDKKEENKPIINYHQEISKYLKEKRLPEDEVIEYLETLSFEVSRRPFIVLPKGEMIFSKRGFETILFEDEYYFHMVTPFFRILFKDTHDYKKTNYLYVFFPFVLILLILIYIWLIKSLQPLKKLKNDITEFSKGNLQINCKSDKKDEIAEVSNEFDNAVKKIDLLLNSRQLFLRTIMHELKTPIAKGRIVSELINEEKQKDRMISIFERLDFLINDFSKVEQVLSDNYVLTKHKHSLLDIFDDAFILLMINKDSEKIDLTINEDTKINADLSLMAMVIKNLIDNALKYSSDSKIIIKQEENSLLFISKGDKLSKPIEEYFKPFHNETNNKNHGMGLGLYIVKSVLDLHGFIFEYSYENSNNTFKIIYK
ncbi:ArsS family sensor histidine kinase [Poseidonibacter lekithochrous]|uniref:ArsS family sensor histidine kinase n=1 Tax=Poseidonibacter lekithochrous TaxID=1904463 RepID=UPI0008FC9878|nr:ArsS family sensor histidine kinase [Poseidonibacter lekithochrous]QKJ23436.1 two-component system sensor histidine kinase [Poseidonibacter lekithochrous]